MSRKKAIKRLADALSEIGLSASRAWWKDRCGSVALAAIEPFIRATQETADWVPHPADFARQLNVRPHPKRRGMFLATTSSDPHLDDVTLEKSEVTIYRLDLPMFAQAIAKGIGLSGGKLPAPLSESVIRLGVLQSHDLALYLTIARTPEEFSAALESIRAREQRSVAILTPTGHCVPGHLRSKLEEGLIQHAVFAELLDVNSTGHFLPVCKIAEHFSPSAHLQLGPPFLKWPLDFPPGRSWKDVEMVFRSEQDVWIRYGLAERAFRYDEIVGFAHRTADKAPNETWKTLHALARNNGTLPIPEDETEQGLVRAYRKRINDALCRFFEIPSHPAKSHRRDRTWGVIFRVSAKV